MTEIELTSAQARVLRYNIKNIPDLERLHFWIDNALTLDGPCGIQLVVGVEPALPTALAPQGEKTT